MEPLGWNTQPELEAHGVGLGAGQMRQEAVSRAGRRERPGPDRWQKGPGCGRAAGCARLAAHRARTCFSSSRNFPGFAHNVRAQTQYVQQAPNSHDEPKDVNAQTRHRRPETQDKGLQRQREAGRSPERKHDSRRKPQVSKGNGLFLRY